MSTPQYTPRELRVGHVFCFVAAAIAIFLALAGCSTVYTGKDDNLFDHYNIRDSIRTSPSTFG